MSGKLKIRELAAQTGLSISTVSRVLAGKSNTSAKARQQVLACAEANGILRDMDAGRLLFNNILVFAPPRAFDVRADIFYYKLIQGIRTSVAEKDVRISYCGLEENNSDIPLFLKKVSEPQVDAAIIIGIDDPLIHELAADIGKPCVLVNSFDKGMKLDTVSPDHHMIGEFSANYLIGQGHRDILVLLCLRRQTMERRLQGIKEAFAYNNIIFDENRHLVVTSGFSATEATQAMGAYLQTHASDASNSSSGMSSGMSLPTAILTGSDFSAIGAISALQEHGLTVPADMSIMSMDGVNLADIHEVRITAVHAPREELGQEAIRLLQQRCIRPEASFCNLLLTGKLEVRESVKRIGTAKQKPIVKIKDQSLYGV